MVCDAEVLNMLCYVKVKEVKGSTKTSAATKHRIEEIC